MISITGPSVFGRQQGKRRAQQLWFVDPKSQGQEAVSIAQELTIHPHDLLTHASEQHEANEGVWWVVYTRSRQEKAVAGELFRYKFPFYLPLILDDCVIEGRRSRPFIPVFARYVFVFGTDDEMLMTLKTNRISRILPVADQNQLRQDLYQISRLIATDVPLRMERRLRAGKKMRIKTGLFQDFEGTIFSHGGRRRLLVAVEYLKQGVSIEIGDAMA